MGKRTDQERHASGERARDLFIEYELTSPPMTMERLTEVYTEWLEGITDHPPIENAIIKEDKVMERTMDIEWRIKNDVKIDPVVVEEMRKRMESLSTPQVEQSPVESMTKAWIDGLREEEDTITYMLDLSCCIGFTTVYNGKKYTIVNTINTKELTPEQAELAQSNMKTSFVPDADNIFLFLESEDGEKKVLLFTNVQLKGGKYENSK